MESESWRVRGHMGTDMQPGSRFKHGLERANVRLDTQQVSVLASLSADGVLELKVSKPGSHTSRVLLQGRLELVNGRIVLNTLGVLQ